MLKVDKLYLVRNTRARLKSLIVRAEEGYFATFCKSSKTREVLRMKRNGGTLSSEPLKARRASLSKSDASTDATVPIKRSSTAVENSKPLIPSTARASSPAAQKIRAAEWAAAQFGERPKISKSPVRAKSPARAKSPGRAKSLARAESPPPLSPPVENPVTIKKTRKSSSKFDAEVLERTLEGISQSSPTINKPRSLRPRPSV